MVLSISLTCTHTNTAMVSIPSAPTVITSAASVWSRSWVVWRASPEWASTSQRKDAPLPLHPTAMVRQESWISCPSLASLENPYTGGGMCRMPKHLYIHTTYLIQNIRLCGQFMSCCLLIKVLHVPLFFVSSCRREGSNPRSVNESPVEQVDRSSGEFQISTPSAFSKLNLHRSFSPLVLSQGSWSSR